MSAPDAVASGAVDTTLQLIRFAQQGRADAVRVLIERLMPVIQARVHRRLLRARGGMLGNYGRDDLVQEIWLILVKDGARQLAAYDPSRGLSLEGYVGMIAERELGNVYARELETDKRRAQQNALGTEAIEDVASRGSSPHEEVEGLQVREQLTAYLGAHLPAKGQLVCRYLYGDHLEPDRIAEVMGVSRQVVYNWQHKIKQLVSDFFAAR